MTEEEKAINRVFGKDPFDVEPDPRVKTSTGGYTKIEDGQSVKMRVTQSVYRYYTVTPKGAKYPLMNNELRELLEETSIDELFADADYDVRDRYALTIYNWDEQQAQVWQVSRKLLNQLKVMNQDQDWEGGLAENDIKVTRSGSGTDTTYSINYVKISNELTTELENEILDLDVEKMVASATKLN